MTKKKTESVSKNKEVKHLSARTVGIGPWIIKASSSTPGGVMVVMFKPATLETHIRYFEDQTKANFFVTEVLEGPV